MSFIATIDDLETKIIWCKCISSLYQFQNEQLKFNLSSKRLIISTMNQSRTSYCEVIFNKEFFNSFFFNSDDFNDEGLNKDDEENEIIYTFLINSKVLFMLFKKNEIDNNNVESFKLMIKNSLLNNDIDKYKLHIEIKTKSMIRKEYNPFYIPCKNDKLKVSKVYKEALIQLQNNDDDADDDADDDDDDDDDDKEINYIMININLLKNFLDNVPNSTEDFKIEINKNCFNITAFTKEIFNKEKEILKQSMSINISFNIEELNDLKLYKNNKNNKNNYEKKIIYKLKEFKNFLNLGKINDNCEFYFKSLGDPILIEIIKNNISIQFIQITDYDYKINDKSNLKLKPFFIESKESNSLIDVETQINDDNNNQVKWNDQNDELNIYNKDINSENLKELKKQKLNDNIEELGPTQGIKKVKGLFD